jgi:proteasome lid subunit RPN8/RPN11
VSTLVTHWSRIQLRSDEQATITVRIEHSVVEQMGLEMRRHLYSRWPTVPRETGGLLGGVRAGENYGNGTLSVRAARGPSEGAEHGRHTFSDGSEGRENFDRDLWGSGLQLLGDWHSHPRRGETTPSDTDVRGWSAAYELCADESRWMPSYLGLIVTPARPSWPRRAVNLTAWVVSCDRSGDLVCQPATVREYKDGRVFWEHAPHA